MSDTPSQVELVEQLYDENKALKERIKQLEEFVRSCADNFDCDHDSHKWSTQCRACDAQRLINAKEAKP
jgi:hypothetical protein